MTFSQYGTDAAYKTARDTFTAQFENATLFNGTGKNSFYVDQNGKGQYQLNIGFGYNITGNINTAASDLEAAGIITPSQWLILQNFAKNPTASTPASIALLLGTVTVTQAQAYALEPDPKGIAIENVT